MRLRRLAPALAAAAVAALLVPLLQAPATAAPAAKAPVHYVALGDSLAYGYQDALVAADLGDGDIDPAGYRGYAERIAPSLTGLVTRGTRLEVVNLSCPGQRVSGLSSRCGFAAKYGVDALHRPYGGSQLAAATAFLSAHRDSTAVITVSLGSNDLRDLLETCDPSDLPCIAGGVQSMVTGLAQFVGTAKALAPGAQVVVFDYYNSFEYAFPVTEQLVPLVNGALRQAMAQVPGVRVASARAVINDATSTVEEFHALVGMATGDIHPTDEGYVALTRALRSTLKG